MNKEKSNKSFEDLFKDTFEGFEEDVTPTVWENIKTGLKGAGLGFLGKTIINKIGVNTLVAVVSSVATVIGTVAVMNYTENSANKNQNINKSSSEIVSGKPITEPVSKNSVENKENVKSALAVNTNNKQADNISNTKEVVMQETKIVVKPSYYKDKKEIEAVINTFSEIRVADIFASPIGGTVPLIVNLSNTGTGTINDWKYSDGKKDDKVANPVHVFENPGVYKVILTSTDAQGKTSVDTTIIRVTGNSSMAEHPRELTPNGDGINDVFYFKGENITKLTGLIFDNKGKTIYECSGGGKWNGKNSLGQDVPEGKYFYIETGEGVDGKLYRRSGSIILSR